jgi:hypothetical protein
MAEKELATATGPYTADTVPNTQKLNEKQFLNLPGERGFSKKSAVADPEQLAKLLP